jgi:hypothetical protein
METVANRFGQKNMYGLNDLYHFFMKFYNFIIISWNNQMDC